LIVTRTSGVLRRRSVCRFCTPGYFRTSSRKRSTIRCSSGYGTCDITTNSIGVERNCWPSDGGLIGNAIAPGIAANFGRNSSAICCCFFVRSSHGLSRSTALPSTTVGKPEIAVKALASGTCA
jgi:hypothetical protein